MRPRAEKKPDAETRSRGETRWHEPDESIMRVFLRASAPPHRVCILVRNFGDLPGFEGVQERARGLAVEERIGGLDAEEETIA